MTPAREAVHPWLPAARHETIYDVDPRQLTSRGLRGLILDLDNTLVPWGVREAPDALGVWVQRARDAGLQLCIVSNSGGKRVVAFANALGVPVFTAAWKPHSGKLRRALALMGTTTDTTALVGDQVFTDVFGGNCLGLYTILVRPLSRREFVLTRLGRMIVERPFVRTLLEWVVLRGRA